MAETTISRAEGLVLKAMTLRRAADDAQATADASLAPFAGGEAYADWRTREDHAKSLRLQQTWAADYAASEILRAASITEAEAKRRKR